LEAEGQTMKKYVKLPLEIEAVQYTGKNGHEISQWSGEACYDSPVLEPRDGNPTGEYIQIKTPEGIMTAIVNDWIIKGVKGEFYPCKPDIFVATYQEVKP
jgi:hypothetical protein